MATRRSNSSDYLVLFATCLVACVPDMGARLVADASPPVDTAIADVPDIADTGAPSVPDSGPPDADLALIAEGYIVFTTVDHPPYGEVGCQYCHCADATGGCNFSAPNIVGKDRSVIANALDTVEEMQTMSLSERQIDAVAAYLAYLATMAP